MRTALAGHVFQDQNLDSCCVKAKDDGTACCVTRGVLFATVEDDIGQYGLAHWGTFSRTEWVDCMAAAKEFQEDCDKMMEAVRLVSG